MKERTKSIDSLRTIAILGVLLIHTTTRTLEASGFNIYAFSWTLFLNQIVRFAVPLFLIISGFVLELSNRPETYWSFIKRRFSKIFIPYTVWSVFYYFIIYNQNHDSFLKVILIGNASYQLYFIPTLCIFYLLFPLIHKINKYISNKFILSLILLSQVFFLYKDYFIRELDLPDPVHIAILSYFFFVIGIVAAGNMNRINLIVNKWKYMLFGTTMLLGPYVFWEGRSRYLATGNYLAYYSQWRPSILLYTILIALTFYYLFEHTKFKDFVIAELSKHSFFVFFVHVAVLEMFWSLVGKNLFSLFGTNPVGKILFDPIFYLIVTVLSFGLAYIVHKIPKVGRYLG